MYPDMDDRLTALEERIGVKFKNRLLLLEAVTHRSYHNENREFFSRNNERLEFLGDAVLEIIVTEHLYRKFPNNQEGKLTDLRSALINTRRLAIVAEAWKLEEVMLFSRGQAHAFQQSAKENIYIKGSAVEAILAALYLDQGIGECRFLVDSILLHQVQKIVADSKVYKSDLQEIVQETIGVTPHYQTLSESGPDHRKLFVVGVYAGERLLAKGEGESKQEAQTVAAKAAFEALQQSSEKPSPERNGRSSERGSRKGRNR